MSYDFEEIKKRGYLSEKENEDIYRREKIFERYAAVAKSQKQPIAVIIGGQPGSGKSSIAERFKNDYEHSGIVHIDVDELRKYHPHVGSFNEKNDRLTSIYTGNDAGIWSQKLVKDAVDNRFNMLYESTLKNVDNLLSHVDILTRIGYEVELKVLAIPYDISMLSTYFRYEQPKANGDYGRFVHDKPMRDCYQNQTVTIEALQQQGKLNSIEVYSREGNIFAGDYRTVDLKNIITAEQRRNFTSEEAKMLKSQWLDVCQMMLDRNAEEREFLRIENQMSSRIKECFNEKYPENNYMLLIDVKNDFSRHFRQSFNNALTSGVKM